MHSLLLLLLLPLSIILFLFHALPPLTTYPPPPQCTPARTLHIPHLTTVQTCNQLEEVLVLLYIAYRTNRTLVYGPIYKQGKWSDKRIAGAYRIGINQYVKGIQYYREKKENLNSAEEEVNAKTEFQKMMDNEETIKHVGDLSYIGERWNYGCEYNEKQLRKLQAEIPPAIIPEIDVARESKEITRTDKQGITTVGNSIDRIQKIISSIDGMYASVDHIHFNHRLVSWILLESQKFQRHMPSMIQFFKNELHLKLNYEFLEIPKLLANTNYIAVSLRRGDFAEHCNNLFVGDVMPGFVIRYVLTEKRIRTYDDRDVFMRLCYPSIDLLARKIRLMAAKARTNVVYVAHNAEQTEIVALRLLLSNYTIIDTLQIRPTLPYKEEEYSAFTDIRIAENAESFMGNRWSSFSGFIALLRILNGRNQNYF